jgi:hypothetical protein
MRLRAGILTALIVSVTAAFAVTSKYISDYKFDDVASYQLSNVCLLQNGGLELAHAYQSVYKTDKLIWSLAQFGNGYLAGIGDSASLVLVQGGTSKEVYASPDSLFFSDIAVVSTNIYLTSIPYAEVVVLDQKFQQKKKISLKNNYAWKIIPAAMGFYVLAGDPAMVYYFENLQEKFSVTLPDEDNIIYGKIINDTLYFCGEKALYRLDGQKAVAIVSFDNAVTGFDFFDGYIFITTSSKDLYMEYNFQKSQQKQGQNPDQNTVSAVYKIHPNGAAQKVFEKSGLRFIAVSHLKNSLIIGTDERGGYFEISPDYTTVKFTSLGSGKFLKFLEGSDGLYAVLLLPSEIVKIEDSYAKEGYYISDIFDAGIVAEWGAPIIEKNLLPGTDISYFFRSGAVSETDYWGGWVSLKGKISCAPARYIQYKVKLTSDGKHTPFLNEMNIPYVEWNMPPVFKSISYKYSDLIISIKWEASDPNNDDLVYDVYIAKEVNGWVKMNDHPIKSPAFDLEYKAFPDGVYRAKVVASDVKSNPMSGGKTNIIIGEGFYIDSTPPAVQITGVKNDGFFTVFTVSANDQLLPVFRAKVSVNGGEWTSILPDDGILDSKAETFTIKLKVMPPAFVQFYFSDVIGNTSSAGTLIK